MDFQPLLARRTRGMQANAIREILKVVSNPGIISLAGGIPSPESFPMDIIQELFHRAVDTYGSRAFQYDLTEGFMPLREQVSRLLEGRGIPLPPDQVHITSGSQGALDAAAKLLVSRGDRIALESPTYLGAISAFNPYEPEYVAMDTDDDGLIPEALEETLSRQTVKFVYLVPTFQNPTGRTLPMERRVRIAEILQAHDALLIEDDPYSALRYEGEPLPPIKTLAPDNVIYISTLSKVFAPGLRIGFYAAPAFLARWRVLVKQGIDLHTATLNQALAAQYLEGNHLERQLEKIIALYGPRQQAMVDALARHLPGDWAVCPSQGGMFLWVTGPEGTDGMALYRKAVENGVAFVPGQFFYTDPAQGLETLRLNYTMIDEAAIDAAVEKLGRAIRTL